MKGRLTAGGMILFMTVTACGMNEGGETAGDESEGKDNDQTKLTLALGGEPDDGFDPTTGWGRYGSPLFQSTLLTREMDFSIGNDLATDYEVTEDGYVWSVTIQEDVVFSDGEPLTVDDVVYTFETAKESASVVDLTNLDTVEAEGNTVDFILHEPQSTFIHSLVTTGIVPEHAHDENYAEAPIGSGPFEFIQWDKGQQLIVGVNEHYYGEKPVFEQVTFLFLAEDAAFAAARRGDVDIAAIPPSFAHDDVEGMEIVSLESVDNRGISFPMVESGDSTDEGYPVGNDVTSQETVRKAINIALDREALVEGVLEGYGTVAHSVNDGLPWWNEDTAVEDNRMDEAKKLLEDDGWVDHSGDGILKKEEQKLQFKLIYPANDQVRQSLSIAVSDMLKPLGVDVIVEGKSWDEIKRSMHEHAVLLGWGSYNPLEMYHLYSGTMKGAGWYNAGYYQNEQVDAYLNQALLAVSEKEATEYWKLAQWDGETGFSAIGDAPWAWLVNLDHVYLVREGLEMGELKIQPHGHGWPITENLNEWHYISND